MKKSHFCITFERKLIPGCGKNLLMQKSMTNPNIVFIIKNDLELRFQFKKQFEKDLKKIKQMLLRA